MLLSRLETIQTMTLPKNITWLRRDGSFDVGSAEKAARVLEKVKYFTLAESLGAVEELNFGSSFDDTCLDSGRSPCRTWNNRWINSNFRWSGRR